jgi:hypothetical protein
MTAVHHHEWTHGDTQHHFAHPGSADACGGLSINGEPIPATGECPDGECPGHDGAWWTRPEAGKERG